MRRLILLLMAAGLVLVLAAPATAQVHLVTPLLNCTVDNANSGGQATLDTPAHSDNGGPLVAPIPINTGNGALAPFEGGFGAADGHCP